MSYRKGELYSLIDLQQVPIIASTSSKDLTLLPFYKFEESFIEKKTLELLKSGTDFVPKEMYKDVDAIGFFDSLHDFKNFFVDSPSYMRNNRDYNYKKFGFSSLLLGGYRDLLNKYDTTTRSLFIQSLYSYLNLSPRPLDQNNLENYFSIGNIYDVIKSNGSRGNIYMLPNKSTSDSNEVYDRISSLFDNYKDPLFGSKIKLVVDFQIKMYDIIRRARVSVKPENFCIIYTAETINDPAPKAKASTINDNFSWYNWYIEVLDNNGRKYDNVSDNVKGGVNVEFKNLRLSKSEDIEASVFTVEAVFSGKQETIQMNSKDNSINKIKNIIIRTIERAGSVLKTFKTAQYNKIGSDILGFYENFNSLQNDQEIVGYIGEYTRLYAKKRLGDTLQARICLPDKLNELKFRNGTKKGTKYSLNSNVIDNSSDKFKGAVLVTHDRMLFSYAVINSIPTILDMLGENIILYVPNQRQVAGYKQIKPKIYSYNFNKKTIKTKQKGGSDDYEENDSAEEFAFSVMNDIEVLVRFLYFYNDEKRNLTKNNAFRNFLKKINEELQKKALDYRYISEYYNRCLLVTPSNDIQKVYDEYKLRLDNISDDSSQGDTYMNTRTNKIDKYNDFILILSDTEGYYVKVYKYITVDNLPYIRVTANLSNINDSKDYDFKEDDLKTYYDTKLTENIKNVEESENTLYERISVDVREHYSPSSVATPSSMINVKHAAGISAVIILENKKVGGFFGKRGGGSEEFSIYNNTLNSDFKMLNDTQNVFKNNISILYFLFDLLEHYELSFINYDEGIEEFYGKIDESNKLDDMIGATNLIPNKIEFYIFLKLILQDYSEANAGKINYALFEYYLYILKNQYDMYFRFQEIKSYLLNTDYRINVTPEIIETIQKDNIKSLKYFYDKIKNATQISQTIKKQNYNASQNGNFDIIYKNVDDYSLKLCGFSEMKSSFITKTVDIISSMASKGLLLNYVNESKKFIGQDIQMEEPQQTNIVQQAIKIGGKHVSLTSKKIRKNKNKSRNKKRITRKKKCKKHRTYKKY